ncbi:LysR family transcriptional regulator [Streptomyces sp. NPDC052040]|uniref:LysR family transcriptional regulator n=1 Tax=Streptomyces sp. NPDC052040 TaxID=3365682 RepID=UPI0037CD413C
MSDVMESGQIDIRQVRSFLVVAQELNFTRAAARLFLTQQAVSSQVRALERALGVQLFERTTRQVRLTPAGRVMRNQVEPALQILNRALHLVQQAGDGSSRPLHVGHTPNLTPHLLARTASVLEKVDSTLRLHTAEHSEDSLRTAILQGQVDIGVGLEVDWVALGLGGRPLSGEPWCAVVGRHHPLAGRPWVNLDDLAAYDWLCWPRSVCPGHWNAVHALAGSLASAPRLREMRRNVGHGEMQGEQGVMLQPVSYAAYLPGESVALRLCASPATAYSVVWNPRSGPTRLEVVLGALNEAAHQLRPRRPERPYLPLPLSRRDNAGAAG